MKKIGILALCLMLFGVTGCYDFGLSKKSSGGSSSTKKEEKKKDTNNQKSKNKGKNVTDPDYTIGDIVTVKGEKFYVLEDSDKSDDEVVLFAVYNLNKAGTKQQPNAKVSDTKVDFSSSTYWLSQADSYYEGWSSGDDHENGKAYFDLNDVSGSQAGDAITKARNYATSLGGSEGRLLTYEEADSLKSDYPDMIGGHENKSEDTDYLNYYLSSVRYYSHDKVFTLRGQGEHGGDICSYADNNYGVRPVITVSKSLIE